MKLHKTALASVVAILASVGGAWAADPVVYEQAPEAEVIAGFSWTGVYIGIQGGYGWAELSDDGDDFLEDGDSLDLDGGFVGVYGGFNYQWDSIVVGIEGDINKAWMDENFELDGGDAEVELEWFGSVRGRVGYAWDRTLFFATAGVAFAHVEYEIDEWEFSDDEDFVGWTAGVGVEHAFTDNLLARAEYRYYDFGSETFGATGLVGPAPGFEGDLDLDMHTISVGLAYKF